MNRAARGDLQLFGGTAPEDRGLRIRNEKSPSRLQPDRGSCRSTQIIDCKLRSFWIADNPLAIPK